MFNLNKGFHVSNLMSKVFRFRYLPSYVIVSVRNWVPHLQYSSVERSRKSANSEAKSIFNSGTRSKVLQRSFTRIRSSLSIVLLAFYVSIFLFLLLHCIPQATTCQCQSWLCRQSHFSLTTKEFKVLQCSQECQ